MKSILEHENVEAYVRNNAALRAAIGLDKDASFVLHDLGVGEHNINYRFDVPETGQSFVLRINVASQPFHKNQVAYEYAALQALAESGCTPKVHYLDDSASAPGKGVLVIDYCEGSQLDFDNLRPGDVCCAIQMMADVHAVPVKDNCPLYRPADPLRDLFNECVQRFEVYRSSAFGDARITKWTEAFFAAAQNVLDTPYSAKDCSHIINTETLPSHFLIPASAAAAASAPSSVGRFCDAPGSFIDWERPIVGEVAQDVAYFVSPTSTFWDCDFLFPPDQVEAVVEDYWRAVDGRFERGGFDKRFRSWRMMTALRSTTWCCRALTIYHADSQVHQTEKTSRKLPVYLSDDFMGMLAKDCFGL